jgi:hypothetical protein
MAHGLKAWNWYLLVTQYNWPNSPINEWGWPNEYYPVHRDVLALVRRVEPWNLAPLHDVGLIVYKPHRVIDPGNFESAFHALDAGNIGFGYANLQNPGAPLPPVLVYSGADWLAAADLRRLETYVEQGGTLITFSRAPWADELGNPTRLPLVPPDGARPVLLPIQIAYENGSTEVRNAGHLGCKVNLGWFRNAEGPALRACISEKSRQAVSLNLLGLTGNAAGIGEFTMGTARAFGRGKVIFIGSNPSAAVLRMVLEQEGHAPCASVDTPLVTTACFRHADGSRIVFVINRNSYPCNVLVRLNRDRLGLTGAERVTNLAAAETDAGRPLNANGEIAVNVGAYDVAVLKSERPPVRDSGEGSR